MSISRRYARAMGGDLWLVPSDEPGAVFELKTTLQVPSSEIVAAIDKGLGEVEIHLFDTHPLSGLATLHCLRHSRANVLRHETFDALLAACGHADGPPSIALLGLDHDTIASKRYEAWLKALRETGIPIMVLASSSDSATLDALVKAGAQQCRSKPLAASTLSQALHSVVLQQYPGLSGGEPANASGAKSEALPDFSGFRVLVADDNQINRRLMMALLERVKVDMRGAANGQEVLDMLADTPADLVILDVHMPVLNGLETARRLRQDPALRDIPVVALTADGMPESLQRIADAGMNDGLIKPIDEPSLWTIIRKAQAGEYRPLLPVEPQAMAPSAHTDISMNPSDLLARDAKRALRIAGNSETLTYEIFQSFCNGLPEQLAQLKTHFTESNWVELRELAHQVRGSSQFCALPALDASLEQLEHAVDRGDGESADICLEAMESEVARVLQEFDAMVDPSGKARHAAKNLRTSSEI